MTNLPVSSAAVGVGRVCYRHSDAGAAQSCSRCRRSICDGCVAVGSNYAVVCVSCAGEAQRRTNLITAAAIGTAFVVVGGALVFLLTRPPHIEYDEHRIGIEKAEARIAETPCNGQGTFDLVNLLNKEGDFARVIAVVDTFTAHCSPVNRLYWESYGARMQVQDFKGAAEDATRLIEGDKVDGDFYWWRAKAFKKAGNLVGAEADLRKASELTGKGALWTIIDLAALLEEQNRTCDAVPLLAQVSVNLPDEAEKHGVNKTLARLVHEVGCADARTALVAGEETANLCSTLPGRLTFENASSFEFALDNLWQVRTRGAVKGPPVPCRAELEASGFTARLTCTGFEPVTATLLVPGRFVAPELSTPLNREARVLPRLVGNSIQAWCN